MVYFCLFLGGLLWGSYIHVIAMRVPVGKYWEDDYSHCDHCQERLKAWDLIPVISYLLSQGRCRYCKQKVSYLYPLSELIMGFFAVTCYIQAYDLIHFILLYLTVSILLILSLTDLYYLRLPNYFVISLLFVAVVHHLYLGSSFTAQLINAIILFTFMFILLYFLEEGMGMGDIKLITVLAIIFSLYDLLSILIISCLSAIVCFVILIYFKKISRSEKIPFGPFLCLWASIFFLL